MLNPISDITNSVLGQARRNALLADVDVRKRAVIVICQTIAKRGHLDAVSQTSLRLELAMLEAAQEAVK